MILNNLHSFIKIWDVTILGYRVHSWLDLWWFGY